jgi:hypothetical protein
MASLGAPIYFPYVSTMFVFLFQGILSFSFSFPFLLLSHIHIQLNNSYDMTMFVIVWLTHCRDHKLNHKWQQKGRRHNKVFIHVG